MRNKTILSNLTLTR